MNDALPGEPTRPLLTAEQARQLLTVNDPRYGEGFSDAEWEQIAERLSALARLVGRMYARRRAAKWRHPSDRREE